MLATHGIPEVITSDNVPFGSEEFTAWCKQLGIRHRKITPMWPAANAQVERFNKTLEKTIRIALVEAKNRRSEITEITETLPIPPLVYRPHPC